MEVDTAAALDNAYERSVTDMRELLRQDKIRYSGIKHTSDAIKISARSEEIQEQIEEVIKDQYFDSMDITTSPTSAEYFVIAKLKPDALKEVRRLAIAQNTTTLRKRVNELGVAEPVIQQQGKDRVVVQLPGVQDTARAKEILGATATLEFRLVDEQGDPFEARETGRVPIGDKLYYERNKNPVLLKKRVMLTGDYIIDASSGIDNNARPAVIPIIPANKPPEILYANRLLTSPWQSVVPPLKISTLISASLPSAMQTSACPVSCR